MFFDDVKTLYDLDAPETHRIRVDQSYSDYRKGDRATLDSLVLSAARRPEGRRPGYGACRWRRREESAAHVATLEVPITDDQQSAHLRITGTLVDPAYKARGRRAGLRADGPRPAQHRDAARRLGRFGSLAVGDDRHIRRPAFVALINLNAENNYTVRIRARRR